MIRFRRRRGFTLIELMVYLGLVSTALVVFGSIELAARRTVVTQEALIDVEQEALRYLGALRRDVEAARRVEAAGDSLRVLRLDGGQVEYSAGLRVERDASGAERGRQLFGRMEALAVRWEAARGRVVAEVTLVKPLGYQEELRRVFRRVATPRRSP